METVQLGCGLTALGREWGAENPKIPSEKEAIEFLEYAIKEGITFFDTAPSYGYSEERLGKVLKNLSKSEREKLTIATKCGERYNFKI